MPPPAVWSLTFETEWWWPFDRTRRLSSHTPFPSGSKKGEAAMNRRRPPGRLIQTVLLVEDNPADATAVRLMIESAGSGQYEIEHVTRLSVAKDRLLRGDVSIVLLDLGLPDSGGIDTVADLCALAQDVPVVVLTGNADEALGVEALRLGAEEYLVKGRVQGPSLLRVIRYACERKHAGQVAARLAAIVESSDDAIIGWSLSGAVVDWNPAAERLFGYGAATARGRSCELLAWPGRHLEINALFDVARRGEHVERTEMTCRRQDGSSVDVLLSVSAIRNPLGHVVGITTSARDMTERKKAEESLRQTQKMESIGILAGGIAHDFNNLLGMIMGDATLALAKLPADSAARRHIERSLTAVERATDLTRQLLAYSGRGHFNVQPVGLNDLIRENMHMFEVALPKNVRLECRLQEGLPAIEADIGQVQQVIMNLIINGAEAIGDTSGVVRVSTSVRDIDGDGLPHSMRTGRSLAAGRYVQLTVEDTGRGMDGATLARIFEPFFTTKSAGRGLGLAAAMGIVRRYRGGLAVESQPGQGTCFELVFPATQQALAPRAPAAPRGEALAGTVLVIDDEQQLREVTVDILANEGLTVLSASDGRAGVVLYQERKEQIDLVVLDLTMRGLSGEETCRLLRTINPAVPILLVSGYDEGEVTPRAQGTDFTAFLQKPFTAESLKDAVRRVLRTSAAEVAGDHPDEGLS